MIQFYTFCFLLAVGTNARASTSICARALETVRADFLAASNLDRTRNERAKVSSLHDDAPEVGAKLVSRDVADDHVISLASGPDIFRPLYVFPVAEHLHLVDIGQGWMDGFATMFAEVEARLNNLGPNAKVELIRPGFLRYRPPPTFRGQTIIRGKVEEIPGPWRFVAGQWRFYAHPCVWRVTWTSAWGTRMTRSVYLHVGDIADPAFVGSVLKSTRGRLAGLFLSGLSVPNRAALDLYLDELRPGGLFYVALEYTNSKGGRPTVSPEEVAAEVWLKQSFPILRQIPTPADRVASEPRRFWPTSYVFERPRAD